MKRTFRALVLLTATLVTQVACRKDSLPAVSAYPQAAHGDVVDDYFGTKVADPYRWMEDLDSKPVAEWVAAENRLTFDYLAKLPLREPFRKRITELWNYPKVSLPVREGGRYFYSKNSGLERQSPVYVRASLDAPPEMVLDPNALSPDGSLSLAQWSPSRDGKLLAYGMSEGGADWRTVHVRDLATGKDLPGEVHWMRFSDISWTNDNKGFFYARFPEPPNGKQLEAALAGQAVYYHRAGTPQSEDRLIYERKDLPAWFVSAQVTEDGRYLLIALSNGSDNSNRLYYSDLGDPARPKIGGAVKPLFEQDGAEFSPIGNRGATIFIRTDKGAPNRKVVAVELAHPDESAWKTVVPEAKTPIESVSLIGGRIVAQYLVDVQSKIELFGLDGAAQGEIALPGAGAIDAIGGREDDPDIFYMFSSPLFPDTVYVYDPQTRQAKTFEAAKPAVDVAQYETRPLFATSKDGTRVPFFLTWKKGMAQDGSHPAMLYGYGGFSISVLPSYRPDVPAWLERGGIWVTANMRGGAEYGEAWHRAGRLGEKQKVFDDFIAIAEQLVKDRYSSPERMAIMGASNGGLLVGAVEEQRPDLFAVALPAVGVMDMLRFDKFTGGRAWVPEYGTSSNREDFEYLLKYSPLQNIKPGVCYPATLVTTADHDDRVVPSHSFKFTATMQAAQGCAKRVLIRVETEGSHGYRPTDKRIAELADEWAFAATGVGMKP